MSVLYKLNPAEPNNPEVLLLGGAGSMSLNTLKKRIARRLVDVAESIEENDTFLTWKNSLYKVENNVVNDLKTIVAAHEELEAIRARGGKRSKGIEKQ